MNLKRYKLQQENIWGNFSLHNPALKVTSKGKSSVCNYGNTRKNKEHWREKNMGKYK